MELWVGAVVLGLLYALMTTGVYLTYRIYNFADITVDGSFTAGGAAAAALIVAGCHPALALLAALAVGAASGAATALIHTRFKINGLLSGILVMTGLYSVNLHLMGRSNIPLLQHPTLFSALDALNPGLPGAVWTAIALCLALAVFWLLMAAFLKTDLGLAMRATGENPRMASANGRNVNWLIILGLALANGLVGVSGGLVAQYQGFADVTMGVGTIVVGLASVIIGESALRARSLTVQVLSVVLGSVIFRLMIALALYLGLNPIDLKLLTAAFVLLTLVLSQRMGQGRGGLPELARLLRPTWAWGLAVVALAGLGWWAAQPPAPGADGAAPARALPRISVVQFTDNGVLDLTRQGLEQGLRALGQVDGATCRLDLENAHGDQATLNLILDKFLKDGADLVVTISTPATQAGLKKITDRPLVFATVANPFLIQAGTSETEHRPNVTGTYGWAPMDQTLALVRRILPGPLKIGAIWDPSQANAEFNVANLRQAMAGQGDLSFHGATVAGTGEVQQATQSLLNQGVNVLVLPPDNIIYSAFDAVVSVAQAGNTPVVVSDVELLSHGALAVLGYDYTSSGEQAARLVDRILRGENPRDIPFERYSRLSVGLNTKVAADLKLTLPPEVLAQATVFYPPTETATQTRPAPSPSPAAASVPAKRRLAVFLFADTPIILDALRGVQEELEQSGALRELGLEVSVKSAQGEMALGQAIAQDLVRQRFDYIVSLSTIALQLAARFNHDIPQVFGAVTDPYVTGVAKSPNDHQPNITGVATFQPVEAVLRTAREIFPQAKRIGLAWNPGELSSEACTKKARELAPRYGFTLLEANVTSPAEVLEGVRGLLAKDIDLFFTSGDSTMLSAFDSVAKLLHQARVPYLSNSCTDVARGAFLAVGPDYYNVGRRTGALAIRLMRGEPPQAVPIVDYVPETLFVNRELADEYKVSLPPAVVKRAANLGGGR